MTEWGGERFADFFRALWNQPPFAWQRDLAERVLTRPNQPWPEVIALPTASGKTACLDVAVFALAAQAECPAGEGRLSAARRIFFVVDRRIIVDEAYRRARTLADKLRCAPSGILKDVADRLRRLAGGDEPLAAYELRGGTLRSEAWAHSPTQPLVVASTVDQFGSRLLFRGYGASPGMWPILAGLAGNDSLVLLDEAHCAKPFMETLQAVRRYQGFATALRPPATPLRLTVLSATPPPGAGEVFRDASGEPLDPNHPLGRRQLAAKPARLLPPVPDSKGGTGGIAAALADQARALAERGPRAVVVFCNRVATARTVHRLLGAGSTLLTGRTRPLDRDDLVRERLGSLSAAAAPFRVLTESVFVVATQTLEVGADLDFDALVTECASFDALRQRFGRLNRMGRDVETEAAILVRAEQVDPKAKEADDPVYGRALSKTWQWLNSLAINGVFDFGVAALEKRLPVGEQERKFLLAYLNAPSGSAPVMLPAHVDCWAQTWPEPEPTPEVALFLRGPREADGDVQICWRADLDLSLESETIDVLSRVPPASAECLPVPIGVFRRWLTGEGEGDDGTDVEGVAGTERPTKGGGIRQVVRWRGREVGAAHTRVCGQPREFRPGDVVVIAAPAAGWESLGDLTGREGGTPRLDLGDRAHAQTRGRAALRLHVGVIGEWPEGTAKARFLALLPGARTRFEEEPEELRREILDALRGLAAEIRVSEPWLARVAGHLASPRARARLEPHPVAGLMLSSRVPLPAHAMGVEGFSDEDDASSSGTARPVPLDAHLPGVADFTRRFAQGLGLPAELVEDLALAGRLHDLGKADPRFQTLLRGGSRWRGGPVLAKSDLLPQGRQAFERARRAAGYPQGGRHELLSVRLAESVPELLPPPGLRRDLVLHLVGSHHGRCRPFAPVVPDGEAVAVEWQFEGKYFRHSGATGLERLDAGVPERYWRLTRHYGWWGLAWLEAILRLADHRRSEWEEISGDTKVGP